MKISVGYPPGLWEQPDGGKAETGSELDWQGDGSPLECFESTSQNGILLV